MVILTILPEFTFLPIFVVAAAALCVCVCVLISFQRKDFS